MDTSVSMDGMNEVNTHSIANISDAMRHHIRRDSGQHRQYRGIHANKTNFNVRNQKFENISNAVVHLFQMKKLQENELSSLQENVRTLITTEAGPLMYDYYKNKLMKKGMVILRERAKNENGLSLLSKLGELWTYFYQEILPVLQALLYPIKTDPSMSIRHVTLVEFRNIVLLKLPVSDALRDLAEYEVAPSIQQMLLVLHSVNETPCTDNSFQLEKLLARTIRPFLGNLGLYNGRSEPDIRSFFRQPVGVPNAIGSGRIYPTDLMDTPLESRGKRHNLSPLVWANRTSGHKCSSGLLSNSLLQAVDEQDRTQIRRYSIATS